MDYDTYFDRLVLREGQWLVPAKLSLKQYWPEVSPALDRAAVELYENIFGKPSDDDVEAIDEWFYRANDQLHNRRPIDLMANPEGVQTIRALFMRMIAGVCA